MSQSSCIFADKICPIAIASNVHLILCKAITDVSGNKAKLHFNLRNYSTKAEVLAAVDRIRYLGENTNTTGGLKVARLEVFDPNYEQRPNVDRIIVLITDGVPTYDADKLDEEVAAVKRENIRILGIGVTDQVILFFCLHSLLSEEKI